ncbi:MAG: TolC family protein [Bacteroidetes bacterium]|nr:TolC family protein [Bacteroidota bacterium]
MTRITKYFLTFILLAGSVVAYGQQTDTVLSLQQCIDIAIKNNLQVRQSDRSAQSANIDYRQAKENLLPSIGASAQRTFFNGRGISPVTNAYVNQSSTGDSYTASANMTLFNGFALINAVKSTSLSFQAGKMDFQAAKDIVVVNVVTAYLNILDAQELLSASKTALSVQQETVDRLNVLEQQGANKAASDLTDQKGQLEGNKVSVVTAQNNLDAARLGLFQLMNIPYQGQTRFEPLNAQDLTGANGADPDAMYKTALQQFAAVKAATLHREAAEKNVSAVRGNLFPTLTLGGGVSTAYSSAAQRSVVIDTTTIFQNIPYNTQLKNNYNSQIYLSLNIPIFSNGYRRNNLSKAKLNLLNTKDVEESTKIVLKQQIEQSFHNMQAAYNRYQALEEQVKAYTESYRIYSLRFNAGVLNSVDLIVSKNNLESATYNMITAKYDYFINSRILDYYQGKLSSF